MKRKIELLEQEQGIRKKRFVIAFKGFGLNKHSEAREEHLRQKGIQEPRTWITDKNDPDVGIIAWLMQNDGSPKGKYLRALTDSEIRKHLEGRLEIDLL